MNSYLVYYAFKHEDVNDSDFGVNNANVKIAHISANSYINAENAFEDMYDNSLAYIIETIQL